MASQSPASTADQGFEVPTTSPNHLIIIEDALRNMRRLEMTKYKRIDLAAIPLRMSASTSSTSSLSSSSTRSDVGESTFAVDILWRRDILVWMYSVVDACKLPRSAVATAAYFMDATVGADLVHSRRSYQIVAMTSLHIALKLTDMALVTLDSIVQLGRGAFSSQEIIDTEFQMLSRALGWSNIHPITPNCFLHQYLQLLPKSMSPVTYYMIRHITQLVSEISVCEQAFCRMRPSIMAYAGVILAMELMSDADLPIRLRHVVLFRILRYAGVSSASQDLHKAIALTQPYLRIHPRFQEMVDQMEQQSAQLQLQQQQPSQSDSICTTPAATPTSSPKKSPCGSPDNVVSQYSREKRQHDRVARQFITGTADK